MKATLIQNLGLRKSFERNGFAVTPLLNEEDLAQLRNLYESFPSGMSTGFYTTLWSQDQGYRQAVRSVIETVLTRRLPGLLEGGRVILCQLAVKQAGGGDSTCPIHSDWSFVDESIHQPVSLWIPLVDITPEVGPLRVVPGSHRVFRRVRPNQPQNMHYSAFDSVIPELEAKHAKEVLMKAGEAVLYDGAILHGSHGNRSPKDRVAVVAVVVPWEAKLYHYWQDSLDRVEVIEVDEDYLATGVRWGEKPQGRPRIEIVDFPVRETPITLEEFERALELPPELPCTISSLDPWRTVSPSPGLDEELTQVGFAKVSLLPQDVVRELADIAPCFVARELDPWDPAKSLPEPTCFPETFARLVSMLAPHVRSLLPDYEIKFIELTENELGSKRVPHQEPSIVDATRHRAFNLFIPLTDVSAESDLPHVWESSHRTSWRATLDQPAPEANSNDDARPIPISRGEVLIYDRRLTLALPTACAGAAIVVALAPQDALLRAYQSISEGKVEVWQVDWTYYLNRHAKPNLPVGTLWGTIDVCPIRPTPQERAREIAKESASILTWERPAALEGLSAMSTQPFMASPAIHDTQSKPVRRIFHDPAIEEIFRHQGYVIVPLLAADEVDRLFQFFQENSPENIGGFHGTMYHKDRDYRVRVDAVLRPALESAVARVLIDYRCSMCNFMVKEPAEPSSEMPLHQDWSFVKEPALASVHIWCPLVDVHHDNGNLAIVPGSHHLSDFVRAFADDIPFREQLGLLRDRYTVELPMLAGQAVLFDGRLVHSSPPNVTDRRRVTAQAIGIPKESPIYHAWRANPTQVEIFELPDEFFFDYVLHQRPQNVEPVEVIEYVPKQLTPDQLRRLDDFIPAGSPLA